VTSHQSSRPLPTIVLVHGAWANGSSWDGVVQRLQREGYTVDVPPNPLQGLAYDPAYLADFLHSLSGPIVLVGHSYGGAVITNAATGDTQVKALVYVDAFAPDQGQTIGQLVSAVPRSSSKPHTQPADHRLPRHLQDRQIDQRKTGRPQERDRDGRTQSGLVHSARLMESAARSKQPGPGACQQRLAPWQNELTWKTGAPR